jgi:5-methylcytosine-specific restriction endonuclease McrA
MDIHEKAKSLGQIIKTCADCGKERRHKMLKRSWESVCVICSSVRQVIKRERILLNGILTRAIKDPSFDFYRQYELLFGITADGLRSYIRSKFKPEMHWENYGKSYENGWQIDHIIPLSTAKTVKEMEKLYHYTNLQPLWRHEHSEKSVQELNTIRESRKNKNQKQEEP